jgi:hypothetical protein
MRAALKELPCGTQCTSCSPVIAAKVRRRSSLLRRPYSQPAAITAATVELIIGLRRQVAGQELDAGAHTIAWHLAEQDQLRVSAATIWRTLKRAGLIARSQ